MSKIIKNLFTSFLMLFVFMACTDEGKLSEAYVKVAEDKLEFDSDASTQIVDVDAYYALWKADTDQNWIHVDENKDGMLEVSVKPNFVKEPREGKVTISSRVTADVVITVVQNAFGSKPILEVDTEELSFLSDGGSETINVMSQLVEWEAVVEVDWVKLTIDAENPNQITVDVDALANDDYREASIWIVPKNEIKGISKREVKVTQMSNPNIIWDRNSLFFAKLKGRVKSIDMSDVQGVKDVVFNSKGYVASYVLELGANELSFVNSYDENNRLLTTKSGVLDVEFSYGNHGKYVEVAHDVIKQVGYSFLSVYQSKYLKDIVKIKFTLGADVITYAFELKDGKIYGTMNGSKSPHMLSLYNSSPYPSQRLVLVADEEETDEGVIPISNQFYFTSEINQENGFLESVSLEKTTKYPKGMEKDDVVVVTNYKYNNDFYNNMASDGTVNYVYDEFGDLSFMSVGANSIKATYLRDTFKNWIEQNAEVTIAGEVNENIAKRQIEYYQ